MAKESGSYGANGEYAFAPIAVGFGLGAAFVFGADQMLSRVVSVRLPAYEVFRKYVAGRRQRSGGTGNTGLCYASSAVVYSGRNKEIISLVRRTSVTSNPLVRHSHHLSNK